MIAWNRLLLNFTFKVLYKIPHDFISTLCIIGMLESQSQQGVNFKLLLMVKVGELVDKLLY